MSMETNTHRFIMIYTQHSTAKLSQRSLPPPFQKQHLEPMGLG